ncbi:hypothetical protein ACFORO_33415 [Amycolatopsis halotolerans]|uniref:Uncharacterized protein n=1 Tax=Amycolatopsis halotolerans TaxID=330083 RepID=A0ABV7QPA1_9PSEU
MAGFLGQEGEHGRTYRAGRTSAALAAAGWPAEESAWTAWPTGKPGETREPRKSGKPWPMRRPGRPRRTGRSRREAAASFEDGVVPGFLATGVARVMGRLARMTEVAQGTGVLARMTGTASLVGRLARLTEVA